MVSKEPTDSTSEKVVSEKTPLRVVDRCDRCGAQAYHRAVHSSTGHELLFCHHHGAKFTPVLGAQGFDVDDQSAPLFARSKPDSSA